MLPVARWGWSQCVAGLNLSDICFLTVQNRFEHDAGRRIQRHFYGLRGSDQAEFTRLIVEFNLRPTGTAARVIQEHKMRVTVKFLRVDAILHEYELDVGGIQSGFLLDFTAQSVHGRFAPLDLAARNAPEVRPLVRANYQ